MKQGKVNIKAKDIFTSFFSIPAPSIPTKTNRATDRPCLASPTDRTNLNTTTPSSKNETTHEKGNLIDIHGS